MILTIKKTIMMVALAMLFGACQESLEEKAAKEALMYTKKNCPAQISENIILDSMTFEAATHTLHYHYTMTGFADSVGLLNKDEARQALLAELKNTTSMKAFKDEGFNFAYTYRSQKNPNTILLKTVFTAKDYGNKE